MNDPSSPLDSYRKAKAFFQFFVAPFILGVILFCVAWFAPDDIISSRVPFVLGGIAAWSLVGVFAWMKIRTR